MLKIDCKGKRKVGKANEGINVEKKYSRFKKLKIKIREKRKKMEEERKKGKERKSPLNCKRQRFFFFFFFLRQRFIPTKESAIEYTHIHIYSHKQNQNSPTIIMYNSLTWSTKESKNYIYQSKNN